MKFNIRKSTLGILGVSAIAVVAALVVGLPDTQDAGAAHHLATGIAVLKATDGNNVTGTIKFVEAPGGVQIEAHVNGLTPGKHGFHIHEFGDISSGDGKSTGGHFNPAGVDHAGPDSAKRHVGDLGNLEADSNGQAMYSKLDKVIKLSGENSIIGHGITIHAGEDDLTSQPTGAAGARLAVAVIGLSKRQ